MELIIRNASVEGKLIDIGINGETIERMEEIISEKGIQEINVQGRVTIPGFVDAHLHLDKSMLNELAPYQDVSGPEKGALTRELKKEFDVQNITDRAEQVILNAIRSGSLYIRTNVDVDGLEGIEGIKALLALREKYAKDLHIQLTAFSQEGFVRFPETVELLEQALEMGADLVGGHTIVDGDQGREHIDIVLDLAERFGVAAEFHVDESGLPKDYLLPYLCRRTIDKGLEGRVTAIHNSTLSALPAEEREKAYEWVKESGLNITVAPTAISTRSLAPVKELLAEGISVALGSDNVRDFFNPLGSGDVKQVALLLAYVHRFFKEEEIEEIWKMITSEGANSLGIKEYGIYEGAPADLTILDEVSEKEVLAKQSKTFALIRKGQDVSNKYLKNEETRSFSRYNIKMEQTAKKSS